jgi:CotH kinase protein
MRFILIPFAFFIFFKNAAAQNLFSTTSIKDIRLTFPQKDWDKFLDSVKKTEGEARLKGALSVDNQRFENVGVRYKGNSSYFASRKKGSAKLPFNIKLEKKQKIEGKYQTLKLSNINRDASFIREALAYDIIRTYMPAPQCNFARVYVNDKLMGLYNSVESIDDDFVKNHFDIPKKSGYGWLVKCDPEWQAQTPKNCPPSEKAALVYMGDDSTCYKPFYDVDKEGSWKDFIGFIKTLNQNPEKVEAILNTDQTLWMLALNTVLVNLDSYNGLFSHNYYMMKGADGRFMPIIWDVNQSFGCFPFDGSANTNSLSIPELQQHNPMLHADNPKRPLIMNLLKIPTYRKIYIAKIKTILKDWFENGKYLTRAKELAALIDKAVKEDENKHFSYDDFKKNMFTAVGEGNERVIGIEELMSKRIEFLKSYPLLNKNTPEITEKATVTTEGDKTTIKVKVKDAMRAFVGFQTGKYAPVRYMPMFDDGQHNDGSAGDGIYGVVIDKKEKLEFIIMVESDDSVLIASDVKQSY